MRTPVKRKLKGTAASEDYMLAGSVETTEEDSPGNTVSAHTTYYEISENV